MPGLLQPWCNGTKEPTQPNTQKDPDKVIPKKTSPTVESAKQRLNSIASIDVQLDLGGGLS